MVNGPVGRASVLRAPDGVTPDGVAFVPTEDVLLLAVELPAMTQAQRRASIAFAVEDRIAQPLDELHVVLGPKTSGGTWLVAVVSRAVLVGHDAIGGGKRLWPDVLIVPVPVTGWTIWVQGGRVLVRLADGTGFATSADLLPSFWAAAGSPPVLSCGDADVPGLSLSGQIAMPETADPSLAQFSLRDRQEGAGIAGLLPKRLGALAAVGLIAVVGHLGLLAADVLALGRIADAREAALRGQLNAPPDASLETELARALAARAPATNAGLLPLLVRTFDALADQTGKVAVQDLRYTAPDDTALLTLEAQDLGTLQAVETALAAAGLGVTAGAATTGNGAAEVQMTLRGGGGT